MNLRRKIEISICVSLVISIIFSMISFAKTSEKIRGEVLRLHVIANSDSDADQNLKLKIRDALLLAGSGIFDGSVDVKNAVEKITPEIPYLKAIAENVVSENGYEYDVEITISREYFPTRTYETVTLPAGSYLALRVIIGKGEGHNWWCVMFPAMCLPAADKHREADSVLDKDEIKLVEKNPRYEPRFKIIELYEEFKNKIHC